MRLSFYLGTSQLTFLILVLLCPISQTVTSYPQSSELEFTLTDLRSALQNHKDPKTLLDWPRDLLRALLGSEKEEEEDKPWEEETLLRAQRGDVLDLALATLPGDNSLESMHFLEGGEGEEGRKRNDALTSIAGGLQAVSREKGGFGFRFGRKRWTEKEKMDRGSKTKRTSESNKWHFNWDEKDWCKNKYKAFSWW